MQNGTHHPQLHEGTNSPLQDPNSFDRKRGHEIILESFRNNKHYNQKSGMGTTGNDDSNQDGNENKNSNPTKTNESTMPRAHSNLDILSQTAAVIEEVTLCGSSSESSSMSTASVTSPSEPARVTPAEHHRTYFKIQKTNAYHPVDDPCQTHSFLALPEISSSSPHNSQPSIFLEKKRGFLPPALSFETSGGILVGGQPFSMDASSNYYSPGLYLSYSSGSGVTATLGNGCHNLVDIQRVMSPPQDLVVSQQQLHTTVTTISTGSNNSRSGGSSSPPSGADGDTAVNSFLANPSNSFSSTGGASLSSSAAVPSSSQYQFSGFNVAQSSVPIHHAAFVPPPPQQRTDNTGAKGGIEFSDEKLRENFVLRQQLAASNATIASLQAQVELLQNEIRQLRQVPSGKISQIPLEEMLGIMREYGSEVSDTAMPPRKSFVQKASVVRQFRRWNPNFTEWFVHANGKWIPKLGTEGEKKRRQEARLAYSEQRSKKQKIGSSNDDETKCMMVTTVDTESLTQEGTISVHTQGAHADNDGGNVKYASVKTVKNLTVI